MTNSRFSKDSHPPIVPVPEQVQRRAWECAYVLLEDYNDRLDPFSRVFCAWLSEAQQVSWSDAGYAFRLFRALVDARV